MVAIFWLDNCDEMLYYETCLLGLRKDTGMSTSLFKYDLVLDEEDICNYDDEAKEILSYVDRGKYVKIFGRRNFGKTSLVKNVVAKRWQHEDADARVVVYCDFYPVQSLSDIDFELTRAFSDGLSARKSIFDKSLGFFKSLKNMQLTWEPPADAQSLGKFSVIAAKSLF